MRRTQSTDNLAQPINEIERYLHVRLWLQKIQLEMAENDNRQLKDFIYPYDKVPHSSIVRPTIAENNFELKYSLL